jgi:hypothetical protein
VAYDEHLGLHPFAEPTAVGPGGSLGDWPAVEPLLDGVAPAEPEAEPVLELEALAGVGWLSERPAD